MGNGDDGRCIFPLTSLQIGDLQSYFADLSLFLANESKKMYILVDNRPWLSDLGLRGAHIWQLMVTKSRLSPFAYTKARRGRKEEKDVYSQSSNSKKFTRCFSFVEAVMTRKKALLPVKNLRETLQFSSELQRTLYGFIIFEVEWESVRGINYLNELQTDTSLAIEAKRMKRWEFDSIAQARSCMTTWFSGTLPELLLLKIHLDSASGEIFYDASEDFSGTISIDDDENICNDAKKTSEFRCVSGYNSVNFSRSSSFDAVETIETTQYSDVLLLFRFNDHDLPFKLREVIISDLRLLTLLEAGLPSWVIFLQSYPVLCNLYRPWMCPLARLLYVLISLVTVLIGFYDLYKNVPVLKATAARICGPLFDWVESWEMVSRVRYLGTMLFLHNLQKATRWLLAFTHTTRSFFSVLVQPLSEALFEIFGFLLPSLKLLFELVESIFSVLWLGIGTFYTLVGDILELFFVPIWLLVTFIWRIGTCVIYPVFFILWEILYAPVRLVLAISSVLTFVCTCIFDVLGDAWQIISSILELASSSEATVTTYEVSIWRSLWNDLFSQIFRALKSILYGFVAFFTACNRHRLSIYNHLQEFIKRLYRGCQRSQQSDLRGSSTNSMTLLFEEEEKKLV
nr:uncharacterized protein LOC112740497 [Arachis hypogaea]